MNRLPTGMYMPGQSFLYRLDPLVKLIGLLILVAAVIVTGSVLGFLMLAVFITWLVAVSGVSPSVALGSVRRIYLFFIVIFIMNAFFFGSDNPLWGWWIFQLSLDGIIQGASVVVRMIILVIASTVLTATTSPMEITSALKRMLKPLGYVGIPVDIISLIISVAIQFIPLLSEEVDMVRMAQTARGARFGSRRLREKAAGMLPLVIPVFLSAFKRADELALAMEARGYRTGKKRPKAQRTPLHLRDISALFVPTCILMLQIFAF